MSVQSRSKRVAGGSSWADAIFRTNVDSKTYSSEIFVRVLKRLDLDYTGYQIILQWKSFKITKHKETVLKMTYQEVEQCRCISVVAFEQYLEHELRKHL